MNTGETMTQRTIAMTLLLAAASAAAPHAPAQAPAPEPGKVEKTTGTTASATSEAAPGVRLTRKGTLTAVPASGDMVRLRAEIVAAAWKSDAGKRALKELGPTEQAARDTLDVSWTKSGSGGSIEPTLTLPRDTPEARQAAVRFLDALTDSVIPEVAAAWIEQHHRLPLVRAEEAVKAARKEADQAMIAAVERRREVRDMAKVLDPSPDIVRGTASRLDAEKQKITLELAGQAARQKALEERVAKLGDVATTRVGKDPVAGELEKIVAVREEEAARVADLHKQRVISEEEARNTRAKVAEARARLYERREAVAKTSGTELLTDLNKELVTLTITIAESEARLRHVDERLQGLASALDIVDSLEQLQAAAARARSHLERAEDRLRVVAQESANLQLPSPPVLWEKLTVEPVPPGLFGR